MSKAYEVWKAYDEAQYNLAHHIHNMSSSKACAIAIVTVREARISLETLRYLEDEPIRPPTWAQLALDYLTPKRWKWEHDAQRRDFARSEALRSKRENK